MTQPFVIVIFGATGDLAHHKLFPALYSLYLKGKLGEKFYIIGFARKTFSDTEYRTFLKEEWKIGRGSQSPKLANFINNIYYSQGFFDEIDGYQRLNKKLNVFDTEAGACITRLFYLATPPDKYLSILNNLGTSKLSEGCGQGSEKWTRLAVEKPFGKDLDNARELDNRLAALFEEKQIYRVDHYLAKETVQNMLVFRFANGIFENVWNKKYIDHVQITFSEKRGVGTRGNFYDDVGILRDVAQNHLLQLLATVAMEQPKSFSRESVRDARAAAIKSIRIIEPEEADKIVVRGQYVGYRKEADVKPDSMTETFAAMRLFVDTPRFKDVPFYIRAGIAMEESIVEIKLVFIQTCHELFKEFGCPEVGNVLTIRIQPNEGIGMRIVVKNPKSKSGQSAGSLALGTVDMKFSYKEEFGEHGDAAYERLLMDIFSGDQMLFNRSDELASSWRLISKIMKGWDEQNKSQKFDLPVYKKGTWGPEEADKLIEKDGRKWIK